MPSTRSLHDPVRVAECRRPIVMHVQCRSCGYEPESGHRPPYCPKCKGGCWETFVQVGKLRPAQTTGSSEAESDIGSDPTV
jgi:hypothetical protein